MKTGIRCATGIVMAIIASATPECWAAPAKYRVVSTGVYSAPSSINAHGDMVGGAGGSITRPPTPYLFQDGILHDLTAYGLGSTDSINDRGQVAGTRNGHPYIYERGVIADLDSGGYSFASARSINSLGQVVGFVSNGGQSETWKPALYHDGIQLILPSPDNGYPFAINDRGQIVGQTSISGGAIHAFMYDDGKFIDLGTLGGRFGSAQAINRRGTVVGSSWLSNGWLRAFRYSNGTMVDLGALDDTGALSQAYGINDADQIVGESKSRGVLWQDGTIYDLNDFLAAGYSDWLIVRATGINNSGQIAASGCQLQLQQYIQCWSVRLDPEGVAQSAPPPPSVEFYNAHLDHYFMTNSAGEIEVLDTGALVGWQRTGGYLNVWAAGDPQSSAVCRFYIPPGYGDSHFFSAAPAECSIALTLFPWLQLESSDVFNVHLPDASTGGCPAGDIPVYRVWNQRYDSNHRYTINWIARDWMITKGGVAEGYGVPPVAMCAQ